MLCQFPEYVSLFCKFSQCITIITKIILLRLSCGETLDLLCYNQYCNSNFHLYECINRHDNCIQPSQRWNIFILTKIPKCFFQFKIIINILIRFSPLYLNSVRPLSVRSLLFFLLFPSFYVRIRRQILTYIDRPRTKKGLASRNKINCECRIRDCTYISNMIILTEITWLDS